MDPIVPQVAGVHAAPVFESTVKLAISTSPNTSFVTVIAIEVVGSPAKIGKGTEVPTTAGPAVAGRIVVGSLTVGQIGPPGPG